jgi:hypothetical protein
MVSVTPPETGSSGKSNKEKIADLLERHLKGLAAIGVTTPHFMPKMAYQWQERKVITLFPSECELAQDLYLEFVDRNYNSEDPTHTLYKLPHNPHYKEEYQQRNISTGIGYVVPVSDLEIVVLPMDDDEVAGEVYDFGIPSDTEVDPPATQMTMRDYAAIHLRVPCSRKQWLNDIVIKTGK